MSKHILRFWFEHGGYCIWGENNLSQELYGYAINVNKLPISTTLINKLNELTDEYATYLDWHEPINPTAWSEEKKLNFINKGNAVHQQLVIELGENYTIRNELHLCVEFH